MEFFGLLPITVPILVLKSEVSKLKRNVPIDLTVSRVLNYYFM